MTEAEAKIAEGAVPAVSRGEGWQPAVNNLHKDLLSAFIEDTDALGYVGEENGRKLILLAAINTIYSDSPISISVKGASSAGKSHLVKTVCDLLPPDSVMNHPGFSGDSFS